MTAILRFDEWTDVRRRTEFAAFQLVLPVPLRWMCAVAREIVEERRVAAWTEADREELRLRRLFGTWYYVASHNKGEDKRVILDAAAAKLGLTPRELRRGIDEALLCGVPAAMLLADDWRLLL